MNYLYAYFVALIIFLAVDAVWLKVVANKFFVTNLGYLMNPKTKLLYAGLFYLFYPVSIAIFTVIPAESAMNSVILGALLGFTAYSTYEFTNMAIIKDWPAKIVTLDIFWGSALTSVTSLITYLILT
jgi:uncharacterized membrane protein